MSTRTEPLPHLAAPDEASAQPTESFFEDPLRIRTILVPLDLSEESYRAIEFAIPLAQHFGATIHPVHVFEGARESSAVVSTPVLFSEAELSRRLVAEVQERTDSQPRTEDCHIRTGKPFQEIVHAAEEVHADLIVIATHGHSGFKHLTLGSTTEKVIRHAPCPVLVVREGTRGPIRTKEQCIVLEKILVPVDFSPCASEGAKYASVFATKVGADLVFMHVVHPPDYMAVEGSIAGPDWPQLIENARLAAEDRLDELVNFLPLTGIAAEARVEVGTPIDKLVEASAPSDVDMLITSTHGYTGLRHALLGSVAEQIVRRAACPVLVVPSHRRAQKEE